LMPPYTLQLHENLPVIVVYMSDCYAERLFNPSRADITNGNYGDLHFRNSNLAA
jgi:hypothetical protein